METKEQVVREGYKVTELGEIPVEWEVKKVFEVINVNPENISNSTHGNYLIRYIDIESVSNGKIKAYKDLLFKEAPSRAKRKVQKDDVLLSTVRPYLKAFAKVKDKHDNLVCSTGFAVLRASEVMNSEFIFQFIFSDLFLNKLLSQMRGSNYPAVNTGDVEVAYFLVPPLKEQHKIAEILSTVDVQIENTDQRISKTKELKKCLMQQLLTKGIGHTEFKKTELGEIPVKWEVKRLEEVTNYVDYRGKTPTKCESGILLITAKNIKNGYIDYDVSKEFILESDYDEVMRRGKPLKGDVLFTTEAPLGNVAQVDNENIALAQRVIKFSGNKGLDNTFLKYYMLGEMFQSVLLIKATGSTVKGIQGKQLHKINIVLPDLVEQQRIADIISSVDEQIESFEKEKEKYIELKKGLMQKLLTGEIRVKI